MFELIRANKRRSMLLMALMLLLLLTLGFLIGAALVPSVGASSYQNETLNTAFRFNPASGIVGMAIAFVIWALQASVAYFKGDKILLSISGAKQIQKSDHPQLFNVVEEMSIASQLPKIPRIYIIDDMAPNAFATGRKPENAAVAVTAGLLGRLNRDELQGVIAHEISHIKNQDVMFMTMVSIMLGTIVMMSDIFLRSMWYSSLSRSRYSSNNKKSGVNIVLIIAIVFAILAPILAQLLYFACSRQREYLADAGAAVYTRYPEGLASALEIIGGSRMPLKGANRATAPMYIANPAAAEKGMGLSSWSSTHPPILERVKILRGMAGGVSYQGYHAAWSKQSGRAAKAMPISSLGETARPIRKAHPDSVKENQARGKQRQMREAGDLLRNINKYIFIPCLCGMQIKLPPEFKQEKVACPRCKRVHAVPLAQMTAAAVLGEEMIKRGSAADTAKQPAPSAKAKTEQPLVAKRTGTGWMSIKCHCGTVKNIAPSFQGNHLKCSHCGRTIKVE